MGTASKPPKAPDPPPAIKVGDVVLDRYRVVEQIACGGHSVVFRGTDERLSRPVCIKVFSGLGGKSGVGRTSYEHFVQEAFALSRLTHPNTLRIYDFGHVGAKDAEGMPLQVCEFMNGGTLSQIVREQGKQSLAETARLVSAMCAALNEAHALGIVHRDIKPQNILFGTVGTARLPKLADFGIAKWSADEPSEGQRAEDTAIVAGQKLAMYSPSWAAPEQLAGQPVSAGTDIYSLAVVAIYMLSGKAIFADEDVYAGYRKRRHSEELVRDTLTPLGIPPAVIALFAKALAFDPKHRLAKVDSLATELTALLEPQQHDTDRTEKQPRLPPRDEPITSRGPSRASRTTQPSVPPPAPPPKPSTPPTPPPPSYPPVSSYPQASRYPEAASFASNPPASITPTTAGNLVTPTVPHASVTPPEGSPVAHAISQHGYPIRHRTEDFIDDRDAPPDAPKPEHHNRPAAVMQATAPATAWEPPTVRGPWMSSAPSPTGPAHRLALSDTPQQVGDRRAHFLPAMEGTVDIVGGQASRLRVTFISGPGGARIIHIKGMTCFVAHLGGRPSPAVHLDHPTDVALVTPRAQEIGHVRVANGSAEGNFLVFPLGPHRIAIAGEDCSDPILFDFGPGSDAYFVYTRGRVPTRTRRR